MNLHESLGIQLVCIMMFLVDSDIPVVPHEAVAEVSRIGNV